MLEGPKCGRGLHPPAVATFPSARPFGVRPSEAFGVSRRTREAGYPCPHGDSGKSTLRPLDRLLLESYNSVEGVYRTAKARGMDLVAITDHDMIDGALIIADRPDVIVGCEVTGVFPDGVRVHLGVLGLSEAQHVEIQRLRHDIRELLPYCVNRACSPASITWHRGSTATSRPHTSWHCCRGSTDWKSGPARGSRARNRHAGAPPRPTAR